MNNKICGYNCEHNKGGVCQITMCDKQPTFSTTTNYMQVIEGTELYYKWYVEKLLNEKQQEIERLEGIINEIEQYFFNELQLYGGGGIVQEYYNKIKEFIGDK